MFPPWFIVKLWQKEHKTACSSDKGVLIYRDSCILPKQGLLTGNFLVYRDFIYRHTKLYTATEAILRRRVNPALDLSTLGEQVESNRCNYKVRCNLSHWFAFDITNFISMYFPLHNAQRPHEQDSFCLNLDTQNSGLNLMW